MKLIFMPWGRVGSNLVLDILSQGPEVRGGSLKLFNEPFTGIRTRNFGSERTILVEQLRWLWNAKNRMRRRGVDTIVNLSVSSFSYDVFIVPALKLFATKALYMDRRNVVRTAISGIRARQYAEAHKEKYGHATWAHRPGTGIEVPPISISFDHLQLHIDLIERARRRMNRLKRLMPGPTLYYEDFTNDISGAVAIVWDEFDIAPHPYEIRTLKATPGNLRRQIANFDELTERLTPRYREQLLGATPS